MNRQEPHIEKPNDEVSIACIYSDDDKVIFYSLHTVHCLVFASLSLIWALETPSSHHATHQTLSESPLKIQRSIPSRSPFPDL